MTIRPNTTYYYRVKAVSPSGESDFSNVISVTTNSSNDFAIDKQNPSVPILNKVEFTTKSALIYIRKPAANEYIEEYKVTVSTVADFSSTVYSNITYLVDVNNSLTYIGEDAFYLLNIGNLTVNTLYYFRITAVNSESNSGFLTFNGSTSTDLNAPLLLGASAITTSDARIEWSLVDNATNYRLDVSPNSDFTSNVVNNVSVGNFAFRDITGLSPSTTYYARVRAINGSVTSANSNVISFNTTASGTFTGLGVNITFASIISVSDIDSDSFSFDWEKRAEATSYQLDLSTQSDFSTFVVQNASTQGTSYSFTSLNPATTYYVRVRAVNSYMQTAYASTSVNTLAVNSSLNPPVAVNSGNVKSTLFQVQWVKRTYATKYKLQLSTANNFSTITQEVMLGDVDSYIFDSLSSATVYYWRVFALNNLNISPASNVLSVTTNAALPSIINLTSSYLNGIVFSWEGDTAYSKYYLTVYKSENSSYLGDGLFKFFDVGNVSTFTIDSFLEEDTEYTFYITGETSDQDRRSSQEAIAYIPASSPRLRLSNDASLVEWSKQLNRLEAAYDRDFKFRIPGWVNREVADTKSFNIKALTNLNQNIYIRGYFFNNNTKGDYSNVVSFFRDSIQFKPVIVKDTSAFIEWFPGYSSYRYQLAKKVNSDWVIEPGYSIPRLTTSNFLTLENLTADSEYRLTVQHITEANDYSSNSLPLVFKTNRVASITGFTLNNALALPTATTESITFDQGRVVLPSAYTYYLVEVSDRSDFIYIQRYVESTTSFVLDGKPDTTYYLRVYGISGTERTAPQSLNFKTLEITDTPALITTAPVLSNLVEINAQEASLQWTVPTNSEDFKIEISQSSNFTYLEKDILVTRTGFNRAILSGFYSSNIYYIRMYAYNAYSISNFSNSLILDLS